jgi:hypothetical protein
VGDQSIAGPLRTQDSTAQKERGHTSMPRLRFETTIPVFERSNAARILRPRGRFDRHLVNAATVVYMKLERDSLKDDFNELRAAFSLLWPD